MRCTVASAGERLRIEVADSGPGVDDGLRETIFERYQPRRGQRGAARGHRPGAGDRARPRGAAQRHGHPDRRARGRRALRGRPARQRRRRQPTARAPGPSRDRRGRAPARDGRAAAGRARRRRAPRRAGAGRRARHRSREDPHRLPRLRARAPTSPSSSAAATTWSTRSTRWRPRASSPTAAPTPSCSTPPRARARSPRCAGASGEAPLLTLAASPDDVPGLLLAGAHDCVVKPFDAAELQVRLDALVARGRVYARRETALAGLDRAFHVAPAAMALISPEGRIVRVNRSLCTLLGFGADELVGRTVQDLTHPADLPDEEVRAPARARATRDRRPRHVAAGARRRLVPAGRGLGLARGRHQTAPRPACCGTSPTRRRTSAPTGSRRPRRPSRPARLRARRAPPAAALPALRRAGGARALLAARAARSALEPRAPRRPTSSSPGSSTACAGACAGPTSSPTSATTRSPRCSPTPTWTRPRRRPTPSARRRRTCVWRPRTGPVGTDASVGVASLVGAGSPGRAFADAGLAMHTCPGAPYVGRFVRRRAGLRHG